MSRNVPSRLSIPSRRTVLQGAAAALFAPALHAAPSVRRGPLDDRLRIAAVGAANRGAANIAGVLGENVAVLCDVDRNLLGAGVSQVTGNGGAAPRTYADWRVMFDEEDGALDGVVVSTPDHTHFPIARAALRRGIPVYVEKPVSHTVAQARTLRTLAREAGVATQMGTQIHSTDNYRRVVEAIRGGAIGDVQRVDVVCNKSWSNGTWGEVVEPPESLDWDLWQGPALEHAFGAGVHPANWRRFWRYGTGTVGDMACHWIDLVHWALELEAPSAIEAEGPTPHAVGTPEWMVARWSYPARGERGPVEVVWYDGGKKPDDCPLDFCHIWRGSKGKLISTYGSLEVIRDEGTQEWEAPAPTIASSPGHYAEWLNAIRDSSAPAPTCNFEYAVPLSEAVLLSTVAYRAEGRIEWDAEAGTVSRGAEFLATEEREGWDV